ncbi:hypothetical protein EB796_006806 [Bugula neritina]|uniref:Uncharacterized protein n=1 Tax=Bugula neritina TaxID=10212 RepID=A0A7J7KAB0_BUGNE|nr:hypothetical protein EB796_006806 [Bugula neritina]
MLETTLYQTLSSMELMVSLTTKVHCTSLDSGHLDGNEITTLAEKAFCELKHLNELNLNSNSLTEETSSIPTDLFSCNPVLSMLDLGNNLMQYLPESITNSNSLLAISVLTLNYNKLTVIESNSFSNHSMLTDLHLENNLIVTIEDNAFQNPSQS